MLKGSRSRVVPLAATALLLMVTVGSVQAAKLTKSLTASFCFAQRAGEAAGTGDLYATVEWAGYRVDGVSIGVGDETGQGFGYVEPVDPAARSGRLTISIGIDNEFRVSGVDIRNGNHVWQSREQPQPAGGWSNLTGCA